MRDLMKDALRRLTAAMAIPKRIFQPSALDDEQLKEAFANLGASIDAEALASAFASASVSMGVSAEQATRSMRMMNIRMEDMMRGLMGLPPRSAVDRLADLARKAAP